MCEKDFCVSRSDGEEVGFALGLGFGVEWTALGSKNGINRPIVHG